MAKNKLTIIFDFDDTLFETSKFQKAVQAVFAGFGVEERLFKKTYALSKEDKGYWQSAKQLTFLKNELSVSDRNMAAAKINLLFKKANHFLYPDAAPFLKKMREKRDIRLIILSFGQCKTQLAKIRNCGIAKFFDKIIIAKDQNKLSDFSGLMEQIMEKQYEKMYFVDDRARILDLVKKNYPRVAAVQMRRKSGRYKKEKSRMADFEIENLYAMKKILDK